MGTRIGGERLLTFELGQKGEPSAHATSKPASKAIEIAP